PGEIQMFLSPCGLVLMLSGDMEKISKETHGYVGADLAAFCTEAALQEMQSRQTWAHKISLTSVHFFKKARHTEYQDSYA
ncbi:cell division cycle protein 48, partial [Tanacetum coccineum]